MEVLTARAVSRKEACGFLGEKNRQFTLFPPPPPPQVLRGPVLPGSVCFEGELQKRGGSRRLSGAGWTGGGMKESNVAFTW